MTSPAATAPAGQDLSAYPLIAREALFGNPTRASAQISPDGAYLTWLAPRDGVLNIWLAPADDPDQARAITGSTDRPIRQYFWAPDGKSVLYVQDKGGDENFLLYGVNVETGAETTLTPFEDTRVQIIGASTTIKDAILVSLNNRDPRFHDVYRLDLGSGELTKLIENEGYAGFMADDNLDVRVALRPNQTGGMDVFKVEDNVIAPEPFSSTDMEDSLTTSPAGWPISAVRSAISRPARSRPIRSIISRPNGPPPIPRSRPRSISSMPNSKGNTVSSRAPMTIANGSSATIRWWRRAPPISTIATPEH